MTAGCDIRTLRKGDKTDFPFQFLSASPGIADSRTPPIVRSDYECCTVEYVYEGRGFLEINGRSFTLGPESIYILHKHSDHKYWPEKSDPWKKIFFVADGDMMEYLFRAYRMDKIYAVHNCPGLRKYFDEMMLAKNNPGGLDRRASVIFHRFLEDCHTVVYGAPDQYIPPDVTELKKILDSSVQEKVCLRDICKDIHQPEAVMIRRFREYFGATPYDYLMDRRIEEAKLLLRHTALSVKEIAARLKFSDQYYFSNYFKRKTGVSPKNHKNDFR